MRKRQAFNPKRKLLERERRNEVDLEQLAERVTYGGNPAHKRNPSDFNLSPPSQPREGKTLCDDLGKVTFRAALSSLRNGVRRGLISVRERNGLPQNIWALHGGKYPVEAMLENPETGTYHGYPMPSTDPFREEVIARWTAE